MKIVEVDAMWFWWFMLCCDLIIPLLMIVIGRLMWSFIIHLPFYGASDDAIGIVGLILTFIQIAVLIGSIFPTEKALKRTFTEEGFRR